MGAKGPDEQAAAAKAAKHADTPTVAHFDTLGRTVPERRRQWQGANGNDQYFRTRTVLDIEGNQRAVIDAARPRGDALRLRHAQHADSPGEHGGGERWMLNDAVGKPMRAWNSRGYAFRTEYDALRRPLRSFRARRRAVEPIQSAAQKFCSSGRSMATARTRDSPKRSGSKPICAAKSFRHFDGAGVVTTDLYDFKGNPLRSARRFAREYKKAPDWSQCTRVESRDFFERARPMTRSIAHRGHRAGQEHLSADIQRRQSAGDGRRQSARRQQNGQPVWTPFVTNINYDAKGQRTLCRYANGPRRRTIMTTRPSA